MAKSGGELRQFSRNNFNEPTQCGGLVVMVVQGGYGGTFENQ